MKISYKEFLLFVTVFVLITAMMFLLFLRPIDKMITYCEDHNWDSTVYHKEGIPRVKFDDIDVKCNKAKETDAIINTVRSLMFKGGSQK